MIMDDDDVINDNDTIIIDEVMMCEVGRGHDRPDTPRIKTHKCSICVQRKASIPVVRFKINKVVCKNCRSSTCHSASLGWKGGWYLTLQCCCHLGHILQLLLCVHKPGLYGA